MDSDVAIVGAGVAGLAGAMKLRQTGRAVVAIDRRAISKPDARAPEWMSQLAVDRLNGLGFDCGRITGGEIDSAIFHTADFKKTASSKSKKPAAFEIDYNAAVAELAKQASQAGVTLIESTTVLQRRSGEKEVSLTLDQREPINTQFVLLADGAKADRVLAKRHRVASLTCPSSKPPSESAVHWVLGMDQHASLGCWWFAGKEAIVMLYQTASDKAISDSLHTFARTAIDSDLLPISDKEWKNATLHTRPMPAQWALEIDSLVEKRTLTIGDAGGFYTVASREGISPAIWSAELAAEVIEKAFDSPHPQDTLREYSSLWRTEMADYLRPPNADLHFLLPLIFSNQQMADRMAGAMWRGENI